jgi:cobalt/nickel transport system permease protein
MTTGFDSIPHPASPLAARDPRWRLAGFLIAIVVTSALLTPAAAAAAAGLALVLAGIGRVPQGWYFRRLATLAPFFLLFGLLLPFLVRGAEPCCSIGPIEISSRGVHAALLVCLKGLAIVTLALVLITTAPLHVTFQAAHSLRVPGILVQLMLLTYRYLFMLRQEFVRLRTALRVRGFRSKASVHTYQTAAHVAGSLLVRSHERAERIGQAMRCRGFDGCFRSLTEFRTQPADVVMFLLFLGAAAGIMALDFSLR